MGQQKLKLAVFISGGGSNLQALIDACARDDFPARIVMVVANCPEAYGLSRAKNAGIPTEIINHTEHANRGEFDQALLDSLRSYDIDLICLAGFMRILTATFINAWEGKIINTHPALLPLHGGKGMYGHHVHNAVLDAGEAQSGVSIHIVTEECDQGPVILQRTVPVEFGDTAEALAARVLKQEHIAYPEAVRIIAEKHIEDA